MTSDRRILLLAALVLSTAAARNRPVEQDSLAARLRAIPSEFVSGLSTAVTAPRLRLHWLSTGLGVLAAYPFDDDVQAMRTELMSDPLALFGDKWGDPVAALAILPGIFIIESLRGTSRGETYRRLEFAVLSLSAVAVTTQLLKWAVGRERPNDTDHLSFPSGHTAAVFGVAEVVRALYGNRAGAAFYTLAAITGISRIHDNKHYLSDVVAGAGLAVGLVRGFDLAQRPRRETVALRVAAAPGRLIIGINF